MSQPLLSGEVEQDTLESRMTELENDVANLRFQLEEVRQESARVIGRLLSPLYKALKPIFGEMEAEAVPDRTKAVWDNWKQKMGGSAAKVIDALLLHGELNTQQLAVAVGLHRTTIPALIYKLNQAGLINKNGGRFSLKEL